MEQPAALCDLEKPLRRLIRLGGSAGVALAIALVVSSCGPSDSTGTGGSQRSGRADVSKSESSPSYTPPTYSPPSDTSSSDTSSSDTSPTYTPPTYTPPSDSSGDSSGDNSYSSDTGSSAGSYTNDYSDPSPPPGGYNDQGCPRDQWTNGYIRKDGTYVNGYWHNGPNDGCGGG
jgi:hypothetical protein